MIDIIIPNWNGKFLLKTCLDSLQSQSSQAFQTIVVDNGSTDGSVSFIQENFPHVKIIELNENKGFSAAVNSGILASESEWVLLLNNDVEVASDCLEYLENLSNHPQEYDFFALKMIDFHKRTHIDGAGDSVMRGGVGYRLGTMENDSDIYSIKRDVFGACAGAALYRRSMFDSVGLFDEDFFAYLEDVDFNLRAVKSGKKCCYLPDARIYHIGSASTGSKVNSFTVRLSTRNNVYVIVKNFGPLLFFRFLPALFLYQLFWLLFVLKKRQFLSYLAGLFESFKHVRGMIKKYESNKKIGKISTKDFAHSIIQSERQAILSIINRREQLGKDITLFTLYLKIFC